MRNSAFTSTIDTLDVRKLPNGFRAVLARAKLRQERLARWPLGVGLPLQAWSLPGRSSPPFRLRVDPRWVCAMRRHEPADVSAYADIHNHANAYAH
jgi:hypothetical protein